MHKDTYCFKVMRADSRHVPLKTWGMLVGISSDADCVAAKLGVYFWEGCGIVISTSAHFSDHPEMALLLQWARTKGYAWLNLAPLAAAVPGLQLFD